MKNQQSTPQFTQGELQVMRILWEEGALKPSDIQERFPRPIKNPALRSYLTILLEKGHVTREKVGKAYVYCAKTRRERAFLGMIRDMVDTFCAGSVEELMAHLIKSERLSEEELIRLTRIAAGDEEPDKGEK